MCFVLSKEIIEYQRSYIRKLLFRTQGHYAT